MNPDKPTLSVFLSNLEKQFEGMKAGTLSAETEFRQLPEWTSIQSLIVLASFNWDYGINVPAEELRKAMNLGELFNSIFNAAS